MDIDVNVSACSHSIRYLYGIHALFNCMLFDRISQFILISHCMLFDRISQFILISHFPPRSHAWYSLHVI